MKRIHSVLVASAMGVVVGLLAWPAQAQRSPQSVQDLYTELQAAVCNNNWSGALGVIRPMIDSPQISSSYRDELIRFRQQLQRWQANGTTLLNPPGCPERADTRPAALPDRASLDAVTTEPNRSPSSTPSGTPSDTASSTPTSAPDPSEPFQSEPSPSETRQALQAQCTRLAEVVNWADTEAIAISSAIDMSNLDALLQMLSDLAVLSDQAQSTLRAVQLTDTQLQTYQQQLLTIYTRFGDATRGFVDAATAGDRQRMTVSNGEIQQMAAQEAALIQEVSAYCGQDLTVNRPR